MTEAFFKLQMQRIMDVFDKNNYPQPKVIQIYNAVKDLDDSWFKTLADYCIGNVNVKYPPRLDFFIEKAQMERGRKFNDEMADTYANIFGNLGRTDDGLKRYLKKVGAKNVSEALEIARQKLRRGESLDDWGY